MRSLFSQVSSAFFLIAVAGAASNSDAADNDLINLEELSAPPEFRWVNRNPISPDQFQAPIQSLIYKGAKIDGEATEVFAFYATPSSVGADLPKPAAGWPAVVLIHGGGGTAFADWVNLWANRGYAAIAMDLSGRRPPVPEVDHKTMSHISDAAHSKEKRTRLGKGGLDHTHAEKFENVGGSTDDDWPLHAVTNVILAHSLIRSLDGVDAKNTAVTGISWGGYTTCLVASHDDRFKAAVPVYGCGFLHEGESVQKPSIDKLAPDMRQLWIDRYDPGSHLPKCRVPILFVNGSNDVHYVLDSYRKSYDAVPNTTEKNIRIEINMRHGHQPGWAPQEIGAFIDAHCRDGIPLPVITDASSDQKRALRASFTSKVPIEKASVHYTTDIGLRSERKWQSADLSVDNKNQTLAGAAIPLEANTWIVSITDANGNMVSSPPQFRKAAE